MNNWTNSGSRLRENLHHHRYARAPAFFRRIPLCWFDSSGPECQWRTIRSIVQIASHTYIASTMLL